MTTEKSKLEIKAVLLDFLLHKPFLGYLASKMQILESKDSYVGPIPTAATDGKNIIYNEDFFASLSQKEKSFVIGHEIFHCVLDTIGRTDNRDRMLWNAATDFAINQILVDENVGKMPKVGLLDHKYRGWSAEQIYEDLKKNSKGNKGYQTLDVHLEMKQPGDGDGDGDGDKDSKNGVGKLSKAEIEANREKMKDAIIEAYQRAKMAGSNLGSIEQLIGDLIQPKINWKQLLYTTIQSIFKNDLSWARPNRRSLDRHCILPSLSYQDTVDVVVSIDTSGSISDEQRILFLSEISGILNYYGSFKLTIFTFDTACHAMQHYDQYTIQNLPSYQPMGGGGTDIGCNFEFLKKEGIKPRQFICLTDGYNGSASWGDPDYCPTTWIIHSNRNCTPPFGNFAIFEELIS